MIKIIVIGIFFIFIVEFFVYIIVDFMIDREWRFIWIKDNKTYKIESVIIMQELDMVVLKIREKGTKKKYYLRCKMQDRDYWFKIGTMGQEY